MAISAATHPEQGSVRLWARDPAQAQLMQAERANSRYLPGIRFPDALTVVSGDVMDHVADADLIVLGSVSPGAEVIADGCIHCYGPLRGRALAGARGDTSARIMSSNFGPELVSIAGVYRTFEPGIPEPVAGRGAQVRLTGADNLHTLEIIALQSS